MRRSLINANNTFARKKSELWILVTRGICKIEKYIIKKNKFSVLNLDDISGQSWLRKKSKLWCILDQSQVKSSSRLHHKMHVKRNQSWNSLKSFELSSSISFEIFHLHEPRLIKLLRFIKGNHLYVNLKSSSTSNYTKKSTTYFSIRLRFHRKHYNRT